MITKETLLSIPNRRKIILSGNLPLNGLPSPILRILCVLNLSQLEMFFSHNIMHVSFALIKGDYDALQTWPFQKKITMMLLDQGNGDHMIDAFNSDPQSSSFQRPKSDMNIASGSPFFMPLDSLPSRQYIKDDVLFIKLIVD